MSASSNTARLTCTGTVLALVRHGHYEQPPGVPSAHLPHGLTPTGRVQAHEAAAQIAEFSQQHNLSIHRCIDCSTLRRAWETATLIAECLAIERVRQRDELTERSLGAVANLSVEQIEKLISADPRFANAPSGWKRDPDYRVPFVGAESLKQAGMRVAEVLREYIAIQSNQPCVKICVGHGGAFRHAACQLGLLHHEQLSSVSMHHGQAVFIECPELQKGQWHHVSGHWKQRLANPALD